MFFFADKFWSLKHFSHLSYSRVETCCNSNHQSRGRQPAGRIQPAAGLRSQR